MQRIPEVQHLLTEVLAKLLQTELLAIEKGYFPELSLAELRTITAIGNYSRPKMTEVAIKLKITPGTLTIAVRRLVKKGFLMTERDNVDRRIVRVALTSKGKIAFRLYNKYQRLTAEAIMGRLEPSKQEEIISLLYDLNQFFGERQEHIANSSYTVKTRWQPGGGTGT